MLNHKTCLVTHVVRNAANMAIDAGLVSTLTATVVPLGNSLLWAPPADRRALCI